MDERETRRLTHLDEHGRAQMVDVSGKAPTLRTAVARGRVRMSAKTLALVTRGGIEKGDVLTVARIAGIMAAKQTAALIPLCHPVPITGIDLHLRPDPDGPAIEIEAAVRTHAPTGVEMEALTAVSVAALTVYDMCKAAERGITIEEVRLVKKTGGARGDWARPGEADAP